jgi:hypothetical protein
MMQEIVILPENEVEIHGKPDFSTATGVARYMGSQTSQLQRGSPWRPER